MLALTSIGTSRSPCIRSDHQKMYYFWLVIAGGIIKRCNLLIGITMEQTFPKITKIFIKNLLQNQSTLEHKIFTKS